MATRITLIIDDEPDITTYHGTLLSDAGWEVRTANSGDEGALFEATHGTAPKYAGLDKINPGSLILSGAMMLDHLGWPEAADAVRKGVIGAINAKQVTYDLARQMEGSTEVGCSRFADEPF